MDLALPTGTELSPRLAAAAEQAIDYASKSLAPATIQAYAQQYRNFCEWCATVGIASDFPIADTTVAMWASARAKDGAAFATISQGVAALRSLSKLRDHTPPHGKMLTHTLRGIARTIKVAQRQAPAVTAQDLRRAILALEGTHATRDRLILTIGFGAALRVSELSALDVADVVAVDHGLEVTIRQSKTDQTGEGALVGIARGAHEASCARAAWVAAAIKNDGPVFRSRKGGQRLTPRAVADVIFRAFSAIGLKATGHSLRAGFATSASRAGHDLPAIMRQTRHKSPGSALRYVRHGKIFDGNASSGIGT
jgi:integrase